MARTVGVTNIFGSEELVVLLHRRQATAMSGTTHNCTFQKGNVVPVCAAAKRPREEASHRHISLRIHVAKAPKTHSSDANSHFKVGGKRTYIIVAAKLMDLDLV